MNFRKITSKFFTPSVACLKCVLNFFSLTCNMNLDMNLCSLFKMRFESIKCPSSLYHFFSAKKENIVNIQQGNLFHFKIYPFTVVLIKLILLIF